MKLGKHGRKRKRKHGGPHSQPKKKQPRSSVSAYKRLGTGIDHLLPSVPLSNLFPSDTPAQTQFMGSTSEGGNNGNQLILVDENGTTNVPKQTDERKEENEYDPKLSELRGTLSNNEVNVDKLAIHFHEGNASVGDGPANGLPKVNHVEAVQRNRCTGAKRRKSGSVKRFKQDMSSFEPLPSQNPTSNFTLGSGGRVARLGLESPGSTGNNSSQNVKIDDLYITEILKPIGFSCSVTENIQDVVVTFLALRFVSGLNFFFSFFFSFVSLCL